MAAKVEETPAGSPWYGKVFECWRNRNRVSPGRIELPDCDFFIVAPRRTLRVLRPSLRSGWYYESTAADRPESVNDNFFNRWARRPHPSGNCRCSFRQSAGALSTTEKRISAELNRIRTSLCEAEKNALGIEELEQRLSVNLQKLRDSSELDDRANETTVPSALMADRQPLEQNAKQQIVKDLERYINTLLEEVLDDTVKHITGAEKNSVQHSWQRTKNNLMKSQPDKSIPIKKDEDDSFRTDINPRLLADKTQEQWTAETECKRQFARVGEGYVNPAFVGSTDELASLDFDCSARKHTGLYLGIPTENISPEKLDCVDSGINSVETIEFQLPDQEPSFEQSLLRIIDEKLGRSPSMNNSEEDSPEKNSQKAVPVEGERGVDSQEIVLTSSKLETTDPVWKAERLEDTVNKEANFEKLRLEFQSNGRDSSPNHETLSKIDVKESPPIELQDYKKWMEFDEISLQKNIEPSPRDSVTLRRNRKPIIVFLHGFGSSAEVFEHQLQYFSSLGYPCIAPDMLGHGLSSAPRRSRDYHFGKLLKDLDAVLHHYAFKPGEKCVLVAHNYGCSFATALACKYDSNIHQLVLISGGGPTPLAPPSAECAGHCCLRAILAPLLMCGLHRDILYSARGRQHSYCGEESIEQWPSHMKYVLKGMNWPQGDYAFHRKICTPTLLVHGLRDSKVSLVQECQMERTMVKAFLEAIPMAGHSPMTECPQQLNHMIHCFIDLWKNKKWQQ